MGAELLGVWPATPNAGSGEKESWQAARRLRVPLMMLLMIFWICLPQTWALLLVIDNLSLVIDNLMSNTAAFAGCIKLLFLWRSKEVMRPVIESTTSDWLRAKSQRDRELMLSNAWSMRLVTLIDYTVTAFSLLAFLAFPLLDIDIRLLNNITDYADRHLLVQSYYPFDYSRSPLFELSMGLQYLGALFSALAITVPENYFGALVLHTSSQFEILGLELEQLQFCPDVQSPRLPRPLANLIDRHAHLITMVEALERSFTYVTFAQMVSASVILCSYGFQFLAIIGASNEEVSFLQMLTLLGIMTTLMIHTLVDCVVGETLAMRVRETKSAGLLDSIYKCHWYAVAAGKRARDLIPMMIMSRRQKPLTAGKLLPLSLATYCSILKTSAGYISVLVAVNAK